MKEYDNQQILSWLEDEQSKYIWKKRLEYNQTHNIKIWGDIVEKYIPKLVRNDGRTVRDLVNKIREFSRIVIFGGGIAAQALLREFEDEGITVECVVDNNLQKRGTTICGVVVKTLSDIVINKVDMFVVSPLHRNMVKDIHEQLNAEGVEESRIIDNLDYREVMLVDEQYWEDDFIKLREDEVFVDAGVLDLGSSIGFANFCKKQKVKKYKMFAFEPDAISYQKCLKILEDRPELNVILYNLGVWSKKDTLCFDTKGDGGSRITGMEIGGDSVNVIDLDSAINEKVTFIKMDIEGAELQALQGAQNLIRKYKPRLAICIYHKPEDIFEIPYFIKSLVPEYRFYIRHYSNFYCETVLFALVD